MEEDMRQPTDAAGGELQLAIGTTFSVAGSDLHELVIKQEPTEMPPTEEVMSNPIEMFDEPMDEHLHRSVPDPEEYTDVIMKRAVSPPRYIDPNGDHSIVSEELMAYYKEKYELKEVSIELEYCDKIWKTLQLIKNLQNSTIDEENDQELESPESLSESQSLLPVPTIPYQPTLGNDNKALPDFRFSIKSKKKLFHCVTCGQEFIDSQHLKQHASEQHGTYVNPKRVYKPKDIVPKILPVISDISNDEITEKIQTEIDVPMITPLKTAVSAPEEIYIPQELLETKKIEKATGKVVKTHESQIRTIFKNKDKFRCFLCKRVTPGIHQHLKNYHKVGCITSILNQCEKVEETGISKDNVEVEEKTEAVPMVQETTVSQIPEVNMDESLVVAVKKRKRRAPKWTIQKKRFKPSFNSIIRGAGFIKPNKNNVTRETNFDQSAGPFKCTICLGIYKSRKTFNHHKRIHRIRGETHENFDPSNSRFLNSPLCAKKPMKVVEDSTPRYVFVSKENPKTQKAITDYLHSREGVTKKPQTKIEISNGNSDVKSDSASNLERRTCDCGRTFRNYHTLFLHEEKCKSTRVHNDTDSGIGISIKIKKNKNDSYEVVSNNMTSEESFKDSKTGKDSDASSNDSGLASLDLNTKKVDTPETSTYSTAHSVLRIQVAEDDEEVDIEDEESDHSIYDDSIMSNNNETLALNGTDSELNDSSQLGSLTRKSSAVPSLSSLCKQVLVKTKQPIEEKITAYKCQTCSMYFENRKELVDHAVNLNHNTTSNCPCGKKFKNLKVFNIHVRRYHPLLLKCSYCMTNFDRIEKYIEHKCEVSEGKVFIEPIIQTECRRCKDLVDTGEPFDKHMKTHYGDSNVYHCFKCELNFDSSYQRSSHFSKEHGFSVCKVCGKFLHIDHLLKHEAYHDGLGHPCHLCRKTFAQKVSLRKHVQGTHDPLVNEAVKCIVCSKSVKLKHLKKHMSFHLHTEICRKCNKCYRSDDKKNLEDHVASDHSNDYPSLKCETCDSTFLTDKRYEEHCQEGSCKANTESAPNSTVN